SSSRRRRQESSKNLNGTEPINYYFGARLYPFGEIVGDKTMSSTINSQAYVLINELTYLQENYSVVYVGKNGMLGFLPGLESARKDFFGKNDEKVIAPFWTDNSLGDTGRFHFFPLTYTRFVFCYFIFPCSIEWNDVFFIDAKILQHAGNEVLNQYNYSPQFRATSVFVVTWENLAPPHASADLPNSQRNTFQLALIMSRNGTFAHLIYSQLKWHDEAVAGFSEGNYKSLNMPGSGTAKVSKLANSSNYGVPGEWLFKIDDKQPYMCAPGNKGQDCNKKCDKGEFYYDCSRQCHCDHGIDCDVTHGTCPNAQCSRGYSGLPTCETDIDECESNDDISELCSSPKQPDCVNTPGAYLCTCLTGLNNHTQTCYPKPQGFQPWPTSSLGGSSSGAPNSWNGPLPLLNTAALDAYRKSFGSNDKFSQFNPILLPDLTQPNDLPPPKVAENLDVTPTVIKDTLVVKKNSESQDSVISNKTQIDSTVLSKNQISFIPSCNGSCGKNAHCESMKEAEKCVCDAGWTGDGNYCIDVDECLMEHTCEPNVKCENTPGGYKCLCGPGFKSSGHQCIDIDECATGTIQCPSPNVTMCFNTNGSYECRCKSGFNGSPNNPVGCLDIDECLLPDFHCGTFADYIDECKNSPCHRAAICLNTIGAFTCSCIEGFVGDGFECKETRLYLFNPSSPTTLRLPKENNSMIEVPLVKHALIFGNIVQKVYVSCNGLLTFDYPPQSYQSMKLVEQTKHSAIAVLYKNFDILKPESNVYVQQSSDYRFLTRVNLNIQEVYHDPGFQATSALLITFDNIRDGNGKSELNNTFQAVLAIGDLSTYIIMIYDEIQTEKAQVGLVSKPIGLKLMLPESMTNTTLLRERSNVNVPGKFIYRIDGKSVKQCPDGLLNPPYCTVDKDECATGATICHEKAACNNLFGSYKCICQPGWSGDGFSCFELTTCYMISGVSCGPNASCVEFVNGTTNPYCQCDDGFMGDGILCFKDPNFSERDPSQRSQRGQHSLSERKTLFKPQGTTSTSAYKIDKNMSNFTLLHGTASILKDGSNQISDKLILQQTQPIPSSSSTLKPKISKRHQNSDSNSGASSLLIIIIPSILVILWLILVVVLISVCMRKRKSKQISGNGIDQQQYGYYLPSLNSSDKNLHNTLPGRPSYDYYPNYYLDTYANYRS
uniref:Uncharacterized protein n=1 Tax=Romanomermis culicivorax TaxID=13658 RepID=A0A915L883_ROMCU